jgi:hypothetical protein
MVARPKLGRDAQATSAVYMDNSENESASWARDLQQRLRERQRQLGGSPDMESTATWLQQQLEERERQAGNDIDSDNSENDSEPRPSAPQHRRHNPTPTTATPPHGAARGPTVVPHVGPTVEDVPETLSPVVPLVLGICVQCKLVRFLPATNCDTCTGTLTYYRAERGSRTFDVRCHFEGARMSAYVIRQP